MLSIIIEEYVNIFITWPCNDYR